MKNKVIIFLIALIIGGISHSLYASSLRLIQVPEYINGYYTVDLLQYVSELKAKEDSKRTYKPQQILQPSTPTKEQIQYRKDGVVNYKPGVSA